MSKYKFTDLLDFASTKMGKMATIFMAVLLVFSLSGIAMAVDGAVDALGEAAQDALTDEAAGTDEASADDADATDVDAAADETDSTAGDDSATDATDDDAIETTEDAIQNALTQDDPDPAESQPAVEVGTVLIAVSGTNCTINVGGQDFTQGEALVPLQKDLAFSVYPTTGYVVDSVTAVSTAPIPVSFDINEASTYVVPANMVNGNLVINAVASLDEGQGAQDPAPTTPIEGGTTIQPGQTTPDPIYGAPRIVLADASKVYDAFPLSSAEYQVEGLEDGDELYVTEWVGSQTDPGRSSITVGSYLILRNDEDDVTALYQEAAVVPATLTVTKAPLYIVTPSATKAYDGTPLVYEGTDETDDITMLETLWNYDGPDFTISATGSQTEVGSSVNTYELRNVNADDEDIYAYLSARYTFIERLGTLTVTPATDEVYAIAGSASRFYNGTPLTTSEVLWGNLPDGFTLTAKVGGSITDAGTTASRIDRASVKIFDADGNDVTENFPQIETIDGQLQVSRAILYVLTFSEEKTVDGSPLTAGGDIAGLAAGETVSFKVTGSQTAVGSSRNTYSLTWDGTAKRTNYQVVEDLGTLRVNAAPALDPEPAPANPAGGNTTTPGGSTPASSAGTSFTVAPAAGGNVVNAAAPADTDEPAINPAVETVATSLQNIEQVVRGDEPTPLMAPVVEEALEDDANPLGVFDEPIDCWVHWYSILGLIATAVYGGVVMFFRRAYSYELEMREAAVLGYGTGTATPQIPAGSGEQAGRREA